MPCAVSTFARLEGLPTVQCAPTRAAFLQGQDQMRIVKQKLMEMIPDISIFLDVDGQRPHTER